MAGITSKGFSDPDETIPLAHGRMLVVRLGEQEVWRSELGPGWNWDEDMKPFAEGETSCPMTHREYVVSGRMRYLMNDGTDVTVGPDRAVFIEPGHRAWVVGDETCVLIDW